MKISFLFTSALLVSLIFFFSCKDDPSTSQPVDKLSQSELSESEKALVTELNKFITLVNGSSPELDASDLIVLDGFANAKVIGVGEATHGTKEFFQMKHRIFKYFVNKFGFRIFGFEADMGECIYIDRFITKGIGTIEDVMGKMHFWTWRTEEVKDLILWMKDYNTGKSEANQIHLLGVDCQFTTYNKTLIEEYLNNYDDSTPEYVKRILTEVSSIKYEDGSSILADKRLRLLNKCDSVTAYFEASRTIFIAKSGKFEFDIVKRLIEQYKQFLDVISVTTYNFRDLHMAENTVWLTTLLGSNTKVISWAHNEHVAKNYNFQTGSQGYHLSQMLEEYYKVIGFSFNQGNFRARGYDTTADKSGELNQQNITQLPLQGSFNYIFFAAEPKDFILIFSSIPDSNPLCTWLKSTKKFLSIGAVFYTSVYSNNYNEQNLIPRFDAVIHFRKTNSAIGYK